MYGEEGREERGEEGEEEKEVMKLALLANPPIFSFPFLNELTDKLFM
ncbi:MAG: hypothetical protein QXI36_05180 [Candidatus Bathyarchaeia archaeon]